MGDADADGPITATVPPLLADSGSVRAVVLEQRGRASATSVATASWAGRGDRVAGVPVGGLLNRLKRNISVSIR